MSPAADAPPPYQKGGPRASGDEPMAARDRLAEGKWSPRERG